MQLLPSTAVCATPAVAFLPSVVSVGSVVAEGITVPVVAVFSCRAAVTLHVLPHQPANPVCLVRGGYLAMCGEFSLLSRSSRVAAENRHTSERGRSWVGR